MIPQREEYRSDPGRSLTRAEILALVLARKITAVSSVPKHCVVTSENTAYRWRGIRKVWR